MKRTVSVEKYINRLAQPFKQKFSERKQTYQLNEEAVQKLESHAKDIVIVVFSAEWCKDCARAQRRTHEASVKQLEEHEEEVTLFCILCAHL